MEYLDKYIPKEYLALKINYCKTQLQNLPKVTMHENTVNGTRKTRLMVDDHRYNLNSANGQKYYNAMLRRNDLEKQLKVYEAIWEYHYGTPPAFYIPPKIIKTLKINDSENAVLDKSFFDSLKNDANSKYPKPMLYPFNGIQYRSAAERDIGIFYTEMGIPFKYEPEVYLKGMTKPAYPDFVLYIPELDTCKFHEHYGLMNLSNYVRDVKIKCGTYSDAGLLIDQDVYFTYNTEGCPLDIRYLAAKLNASVFGTLTGGNEWIQNETL